MPKELHIEFIVCKQDTPATEKQRAVFRLGSYGTAGTNYCRYQDYSTTLIAWWNVEQRCMTIFQVTTRSHTESFLAYSVWFWLGMIDYQNSWFAVTSKIVGFCSVCRYAVNWSFSSFEQENKNQFLRGGAGEVIRVKMWNWQDANNSN